MNTTHTITLHHQYADESEAELKASVSLLKGTRGHDPSDFEIEWLGDSAEAIDLMYEETVAALEQQAREGWFDAMRDEPTDEEIRVDCELQRWKEERHL